MNQIKAEQKWLCGGLLTKNEKVEHLLWLIFASNSTIKRF